MAKKILKPSYVLARDVLDPHLELEISKDEFMELKTSRNVLIGALGMEEKYEILLRSFIELEKLILEVAALGILRSHHEYSHYFEVRSGFNSRLLNLLSAARLYVDQLNQDVSKCRPECGDVKARVHALFVEQYDKCKEYRFMEGLRNYVQHWSLPVHSTSHNFRRVDHDSCDLLEFSVAIFSKRELLANDKKIKASVINELPDDINLAFYARRYMEALSQVHQGARALAACEIDSARSLVETARQKYRESSSGSLIGLAAFSLESGSRLECVPLLLEWDDVRIQLQSRNQTLTNLHRKYVSGKV